MEPEIQAWGEWNSNGETINHGSITIELPDGTELKKADKLVALIQKTIKRFERCENGTKCGSTEGPGDASSNAAIKKCILGQAEEVARAARAMRQSNGLDYGLLEELEAQTNALYALIIASEAIRGAEE